MTPSSSQALFSSFILKKMAVEGKNIVQSLHHIAHKFLLQNSTKSFRGTTETQT